MTRTKFLLWTLALSVPFIPMEREQGYGSYEYGLETYGGN